MVLNENRPSTVILYIPKNAQVMGVVLEIPGGGYQMKHLPIGGLPVKDGLKLEIRPEV